MAQPSLTQDVIAPRSTDVRKWGSEVVIIRFYVGALSYTPLLWYVNGRKIVSSSIPLYS